MPSTSYAGIPVIAGAGLPNDVLAVVTPNDRTKLFMVMDGDLVEILPSGGVAPRRAPSHKQS